METDNTKTAIDLLATNPELVGCTWDERGITPIRDTSAAPLPLRECGIFRPLPQHVSQRAVWTFPIFR